MTTLNCSFCRREFKEGERFLRTQKCEVLPGAKGFMVVKESQACVIPCNGQDVLTLE